MGGIHMLVWRTKRDEKMLKTEIESKRKKIKNFVKKIKQWNEGKICRRS